MAVERHPGQGAARGGSEAPEGAAAAGRLARQPSGAEGLRRRGFHRCPTCLETIFEGALAQKVSLVRPKYAIYLTHE